MLTLYYRLPCPFCIKVLDFARSHDIPLTLRSITEEQEAANELVDHGGKRQVPYLVDDERGNAMYESDEIIAYLQEHYVG